MTALRRKFAVFAMDKEVAKQTVINKMQTKQTDSMDAANLSERIATLYKKVMQR